MSTDTTEAPRPRAFNASELVQCSECSRPNPPTRAVCLYCGATLEPADKSNVQPALAPEKTDSTDLFHLVAFSEGAGLNEAALREIAATSNLSLTELQTLLRHSPGAPLLSANSHKEVAIAAEKLRAAGIDTAIVTDQDLLLSMPQQEIVKLEFDQDVLVGSVRRTGEKLSVSWASIFLIVVARLYRATTEIDQKRNRNKAVIAEREFMTDEAVLDLYLRDEQAGWRIRAGDFDFSGLGDEKRMTVFENFATLVRRLRERAPAAAFDDSYPRLRSSINKVWPLEPRDQKKDKRRTVFGAYDSSATITDNEQQFSRYSRLLRFLTLRNDADKA